MSDNLFALVRARAAKPDRAFLRTLDGRTLTYADMIEMSARFAAVLCELGVEPGDRVAAQVEKSPEAFLLYLGCLRAGAVYLPLNTAYTLAEVEYFLADAEPRVVVCTPERFETLAPLAEKLGVEQVVTLANDGLGGTLWQRLAAASPAFSDVERIANDLAAILYTSGTTGRSKGAMLSHRNLAANAEALRRCWQFGERDVLLHALPVFHTHGLFVAGNVALLAGASMIFLPKFHPDEIFRALPAATAMMGVPTFYVRLLEDARLDREATAHMRLFISGSAPLLAETHRAWRERTGHSIVERYGLTETSINTSNPCDGECVAGSVGPPLPGVEVRITDPETGIPLAAGEIGMIEVRGENVFRGYWRMPEKTAAELRADGFFITGDLGRIDERGYVYIVGRSKDLIISGGYNVYPKEVESEIDAIAGVAESAVIGVPDRDFGEAVTAVVTRKPGSALSEADILAALKERLAAYKRPKRVFFLDELPRNAMGKVEKNALRAQFEKERGWGLEVGGWPERMDTAIQYRLTPALPSDAVWLEDLRRSVYRDLFQATWGGWDEARHARHFADCIQRGHISIIEVDAQRVGMVQLFDEPDAVEVGEIQVQPSHQSRGIGTCVLMDVIAAARERRKSVRLRVGLKNDRAFKLYQRLGFRRVARTETHDHMECSPAPSR